MEGNKTSNMIMTRDEIKDSIIRHRQQTNQRELKNSSIFQYIQNFSKLQNVIEPNEELNIKFIYKTDEIEDKLNNYSLTTRRNYYNCIIIIIESNRDKYSDDIDDSIKNFIQKRDTLNEEYNQNNKSHKYSGKQAENCVTKKEIMDMLIKIKKEVLGKELFKKTRDEMGNYNYALLMYYVCVSIHIVCPLRNDLAFLKVFNYKDTPTEFPENYMIIKKDQVDIVLNDYKTNKDNKTAVIQLKDKTTINLLKRYIKMTGYDDYLLQNNDGTPLSKNGLSHLFTKFSTYYLKKNVSTTLLRKCFYTDKYGHLIDEMEQDAANNLHSLGTALNVYTKSSA
tara:strand:+ start:1613 stop:2623 length:1011 start_codon:yes stop_codon:yes gene_type:complete